MKKEKDFILFFRFPTDDLFHCHATNVVAFSASAAVSKFLHYFDFVSILGCIPGMVCLFGKPWCYIDLSLKNVLSELIKDK